MRIIRSGKAVRDLVEHYAYIGLDSPDAAERFVTAAEQAFRDLAHMPDMGRHRQFPDAPLAGLRQWHVPGFRNYLIFYRPVEGGIEVLRVLHGARDIKRLFQEDEVEDEGEP